MTYATSQRIHLQNMSTKNWSTTVHSCLCPVFHIMRQLQDLGGVTDDVLKLLHIVK